MRLILLLPLLYSGSVQEVISYFHCHISHSRIQHTAGTTGASSSSSSSSSQMRHSTYHRTSFIHRMLLYEKDYDTHADSNSLVDESAVVTSSSSRSTYSDRSNDPIIKNRLKSIISRQAGGSKVRPAAVVDAPGSSIRAVSKIDRSTDRPRQKGTPPVVVVTPSSKNKNTGGSTAGQSRRSPSRGAAAVSGSSVGPSRSRLREVPLSRDQEWSGSIPVVSDAPSSIVAGGDNVDVVVDEDDDDGLGPQGDSFKSGFISIVGNPNVGKSTLMNAILGQTLCIVSPKPQTTRHRILGILTEPTQYQLVFSDTPGMLTPAYKLQETMQETVRGAVSDADVILLVTDVFGEPLADEKVMSRLAVSSRPVVVVVNKIDLAPEDMSLVNITTDDAQYEGARDIDDGLHGGGFDREDSSNDELVPSSSSSSSRRGDRKQSSSSAAVAVPLSLSALRSVWKQRLPLAAVVGVSALRGEGVGPLLDAVLQHLSPGPKYFPSEVLTNRDERFFAAEIVRESLLALFKDEIPYSCEVVIDSFRDKSKSLSVIEAGIIASRNSQKAILIGKQGAKLKELGTVAREKLEKFLQRKVFLSLQVRVDPDWRGNVDALTKYGYIESDFA